MFCPEGYVTLNEIYNGLWLWAQGATERSVEDAELLAKFEQAGEPKKFGIDTGSAAFDECEAHAKWLMLVLLELYGTEVRIALPTGAVVRIEPWLLAPKWSPFDREDWQDHNLYTDFPSKREDRLEILQNDLQHIEERAFTIDCQKTDDRYVEASLRLVHGCPFCIRDGILPSEGSLPGHLKTAIRAKLLEPDGPGLERAEHASLVAKVIQTVETRRLPRDIVKAILAPQMKVEEWRALWRQAAHQRPDLRLSVSGPKRPRNS